MFFRILKFLAFYIALTSCRTRIYNTESATTELTLSKNSSAVLSITAARNTFLKVVSKPVGMLESYKADEICFVKKGTVLQLSQKVKASQSKDSHYFIKIASEIPKVAVSDFSNEILGDSRFQKFGGSAAAVAANLYRVDQDIRSDSLQKAEAEVRRQISTSIPDEFSQRDDSASVDQKVGFQPEVPELSDENSIFKTDTISAVSLPEIDVDIENPIYANQVNACPFSEVYAFKGDWNGDVIDSKVETPAIVQEYLKAFRSCVAGAGYLLGASQGCNALMDCSSAIQMTHYRQKQSMVGSQADLDSQNFVACKPGDYRPGDHILMGRSTPDHWVTLVSVKNKFVANDPQNEIIDMSSDCSGFCPGSMRRNISSLSRRVYGCARHKDFVKAWEKLK